MYEELTALGVPKQCRLCPLVLLHTCDRAVYRDWVTYPNDHGGMPAEVIGKSHAGAHEDAIQQLTEDCPGFEIYRDPAEEFKIACQSSKRAIRWGTVAVFGDPEMNSRS